MSSSIADCTSWGSVEAGPDGGLLLAVARVVLALLSNGPSAHTAWAKLYAAFLKAGIPHLREDVAGEVEKVVCQ